MCVAGCKVRMHDTEGGALTVCVRMLLVMSLLCMLLVHILGFCSCKGEMNYYQNNWSVTSVESVIRVWCGVSTWRGCCV